MDMLWLCEWHGWIQSVFGCHKNTFPYSMWISYKSPPELKLQEQELREVQDQRDNDTLLPLLSVCFSCAPSMCHPVTQGWTWWFSNTQSVSCSSCHTASRMLLGLQPQIHRQRYEFSGEWIERLVSVGWFMGQLNSPDWADGETEAGKKP